MTAASPVGQLESGRVTPSHKWLIALAVMLGPALEVLDTSIINVALPHLQGVFSASVDEIAWVLTNQLPRGQRGHDPDDRLDFLSLWPQALFPYFSLSSAPPLYVARRSRSAKWSYSVLFTFSSKT